MKATIALLAILLMISTLLVAQEELEMRVEPEVTVFTFGQNLEGDLMMVQGMVRIDSRAPMGMLGGFISGMTGQAEIWLDSILLVESTAEKSSEEADLAQEEEELTEEVDSMAEATGDESLSSDEPDSADTEDIEIEEVIEPPAGYTMPRMTMHFPLSTLTTGNAYRDSVIMSETYLDITNYPTATFKLTRIESPSSFELEDNIEISATGSGEITLHGQTKSIGNIRIYMTYISEKPLTEQNLELTGNVLHVNAELNIKLSDFGIVIPTEDLLTLNDEVLIIFDGYGVSQPTSM